MQSDTVFMRFNYRPIRTKSLTILVGVFVFLSSFSAASESAILLDPPPKLQVTAPSEFASDDFEQPTLQEDKWVRFEGSTAQIINGSDIGMVAPDSWLLVGWQEKVFEPDQFSEAVISPDKPDNVLTQVYVRRTFATGARYGFHYNADPGKGQWEIKYDGVATEFTKILALDTDAPPPQPGDTLRVEVVGTNPVTISGFHNGVKILSTTDSSPERLDGGAPEAGPGARTVGMVARLAKNSSLLTQDAPVFESWTGGSISCPVFPNNALRSADRDGDGTCEDLDGDESLGFNDVIIFFRSIDSKLAASNLIRFDFNLNMNLDFADVIELFKMTSP